MAAYNFKDLEAVVAQWASTPSIGIVAQEVGDVLPEYTFHNPTPSNITLVAGTTEMLKVAEDGCYVRGEKVPADDKEAETVYKAFKQFLVWAELHRN